MTTIAWDGRTLAADRARVNGRGTVQACLKIFDCGAYVYGGTGDFVDLTVICRWLRAGAKWKDRPAVTEGNGGLVVRKKDGVLFILDGNPATLCEVPRGFTAAGSGSPYALAAMECGRTARQAVEVAMKFDDGTALGVDSFVVVPR